MNVHSKLLMLKATSGILKDPVVDKKDVPESDNTGSLHMCCILKTSLYPLHRCRTFVHQRQQAALKQYSLSAGKSPSMQLSKSLSSGNNRSRGGPIRCVIWLRVIVFLPIWTAISMGLWAHEEIHFRVYVFICLLHISCVCVWLISAL